MTKVRFDELPRDMQAQVRAQLGETAIAVSPAKKKRTTRKQVPANECTGVGVCSCGLECDWRGYVKHRTANPTAGHGRWAYSLTPTTAVVPTVGSTVPLMSNEQEHNQ